VVGENEDKKPMNAILGAKGLSALTTLKSAGDFLRTKVVPRIHTSLDIFLRAFYLFFREVI
jgi:hypothetical protein